MAKYDHGGGCPCGLQKECDCGLNDEEERRRAKIREETHPYTCTCRKCSIERDGIPF